MPNCMFDPLPAILSLANTLGLRTVAEGVETEAQLEFIKQHNCHLAQGHLFYPAMPNDEYRQLMQQSQMGLSAMASPQPRHS